MVAQKGRLLLIQIEDASGSDNFINVGGLRTKSVKLGNESVDVTNDDSVGARKLLEGAGVNSLEVTGSGVASDTQGFDILREHAENNTHPRLRITVPGDTYSRVYEGIFQVTELEQAGEYNQSITFSATFASDGEITKERIDA